MPRRVVLVVLRDGGHRALRVVVAGVVMKRSIVVRCGVVRKTEAIGVVRRRDSGHAPTRVHAALERGVEGVVFHGRGSDDDWRPGREPAGRRRRPHRRSSSDRVREGRRLVRRDEGCCAGGVQGGHGGEGRRHGRGRPQLRRHTREHAAWGWNEEAGRRSLAASSEERRSDVARGNGGRRCIQRRRRARKPSRRTASGVGGGRQGGERRGGGP
mmetsp:Transcript_10907/g.44205  ORF Transcript_10907/g.44205 Transcript_10907/m.44205 type:complete len:213 (+) Transcript_10907:425-1063(+)